MAMNVDEVKVAIEALQQQVNAIGQKPIEWEVKEKLLSRLYGLAIALGFACADEGYSQEELHQETGELRALGFSIQDLISVQ